MDNSFNVPDPSDWLQTPVSQLGPVETALRCQVCKDFYNTPMITSCSHTFCSLCIRRCLTTDGRCPSCRAQDQEIKLRLNTIVQELVDAFQVARPVVLQLVEDVKALKEQGGKLNGKRKLEETDIEEDDVREKIKGQGRRTRSQYRKYSPSHDLPIAQEVDDDKDEDFQPDDGLIACPICSARMKEEAVFSHLDIHSGQDNASRPQMIPTRKSPHFTNVASSSQPPKATERLPQMNYPLLKDNALRKKLSELGIPSGGPRALLIRRHTEWVNLVNANCDSARPRSKRELLRELDMWDKTQGRQVVNGPNGSTSASSVMHKDFDGAAWASSHDQDFQTLIAKARRKANPRAEEASITNEAAPPVSDHANRIADLETDPPLGIADKPGLDGNLKSREHADQPCEDPRRPSHASFVDLVADS